MSGLRPPQAGTEERWGAKRREGEKWDVERGGGCEIGEGVRCWKYGGRSVSEDKQVALMGSTTGTLFCDKKD